MSKKFLVQFNVCSKSGKKLNQNLFENLDDALTFSIQLVSCANIDFIGLFESELQIFNKIDVCNELHSENGKYAKLNEKKSS